MKIIYISSYNFRLLSLPVLNNDVSKTALLKRHERHGNFSYTTRVTLLPFMWGIYNTHMGAIGQEMVREKKFFKVRETSENWHFEEKSGKIGIARLIKGRI